MAPFYISVLQPLRPTPASPFCPHSLTLHHTKRQEALMQLTTETHAETRRAGVEKCSTDTLAENQRDILCFEESHCKQESHPTTLIPVTAKLQPRKNSFGGE